LNAVVLLYTDKLNTSTFRGSEHTVAFPTYFSGQDPSHVVLRPC